MNMGKRLSELREADKISGESSYVVEMGDGTGTKQVKHKNLVGQLLEDMEMTYDQTMELLGSTDGEGDKKIPNVKAISDWIASKITNNLLATEAGYFLDARQGPVIQGEIDSLTTKVNQINSNLNNMLPTGGYYNGITTSINDIVTPGISRIYIQKNSDAHKYLEYYGACLIINSLCAGYLYQILFFSGTAAIAWRVNEVQHDITLTYQTKLFKVTGEVIER